MNRTEKGDIFKGNFKEKGIQLLQLGGDLGRLRRT